MPTNFQSLSSWHKLRSVPFYFFYYYVPTRYTGLSSESDYIRRQIWHFKDGSNQDQFVDQLATKLSHTFGNADALTLVCIPASTVRSNVNRYERFSNALCAKLHMTNGFQHISILKEKSPSHLGGNDEAVFEFDKNFFSRKKIVLFDDVVTRGSSMQSFMDYLEELGAEIVCCISLGRTYWDQHMSDKVPHPWTGKAVFRLGCDVDPDPDNRTYVAPVKDEIVQAVIAENDPFKDEITHDSAPVKDEITHDNAIDAAILNKILDKEQPNAQHKIGDFVRFGRLNGRPVQWIVLDQKDDEYLLISKFGLDCRQFHTTNTFITWDKCSLRTWLNTDFYNNTFSRTEQEKIIQHEVIASDNPLYRTYQGQNTKDKLFILSIREYNKYFDMYNKWVCRLFSGIMRQCWLRNSGNDSCHASFIGRSGSIHAGGSKIISARNAVRPLMWVKL